MIRRIVDDERGFLATYLLTIYLIVCLIAFGVMLATIEGVQKNAMASFQWFQAAGQYAVTCANLQGISSDPEDNESTVEQYFDDGFSAITQTTTSGSEFDPGAGSPFPEVIQLTEFDPVDQGGAIPGGTAAGPGYLVGIKVPILVGDVPFLGPESISVLMKSFFQLGSSS